MRKDKALLLKLARSDRSGLNPDELKRSDELRKTEISRPLVMVNSSTSGIVAGSLLTWKAVESYAADRSIELDLTETGSIGLSSEDPVVSVQIPGRTRIFFSRITEGRVPSLLDDLFHQVVPDGNVIGQLLREGQEPWENVPALADLPFFALQNRIVMESCGIIDPFSLEEYMAGGGYGAFIRTIRSYTFSEVCELVTASGLRGRSGGGFSTGEKWKAAFRTPSDQKYLICNAEESDPGAFMDRTLMEGNPFQLLEGISIAAYAIGSNRAYIYIRSEYKDAIRRINNAIKELREIGLLGDNILDSGYNLQISLRKGPGAFVCGEETALIASLEGKRGMPSSKPPYPTTSGYLGRPTVVNNVETLSNLPGIIRKGPEWFRSIGTEESPGTKIFSISGRVALSGLVEVPMGTSFDTIINKIIGGAGRGRELKALHLGGPSGCMVPLDLMDLPVSYEALKEKGLIMGSGGVLVMDDRTCVVNTVRFFMYYLNKQSCGKCIPCREGTRRMAEILASITRKPADEEGSTTLERFKGVMQLESLAEVMKDTSLCGLGQNAPNPVVSTLKYFRHEYEEHIFERRCPSNTCTELRTWYIDVDLCTGCTVCAKKCPADAIIGTARHPYFIVQEKCIGCGICYDVCKFSAVYYK
ncbi:MAG: NADH-ubiquinone oxidoreductase-F iron-sulfur binding region domain-containing protein [Bacteroidales bacterium]|nr:NADH-ubiquinone oxidoreductase-F iron-sulfur binding region domain-containing protein [Bacteroidales bacterium]